MLFRRKKKRYDIRITNDVHPNSDDIRREIERHVAARRALLEGEQSAAGGPQESRVSSSKPGAVVYKVENDGGAV